MAVGALGGEGVIGSCANASQAPASPWPTSSGETNRNGSKETFGAGFVVLTEDRYGYHMPRTNARDAFYIKLESERAENKQ